jgi:membrane carboxypeptidase/penicillin-binding protein PbpC
VAGYTPENFDRTFLGPLSAEEALVRSRNVPNHLLSAVFDLASAVKLQSDLSASVAIISTASNLMAQNVSKEIGAALERKRIKR